MIPLDSTSFRPSDYSSGRQASKDDDRLAILRDAVRAQQDGLYAIQTQWYEQILFVRGMQHMFYHRGLGRTVPYPQAEDHRVRIVYNEILPIIEGQQALLLSREPKRSVMPIGSDHDVVTAAEFSSDLLDWASEQHAVEEVAMDVASYLTETGNAFVFCGWDPTSGRALADDRGNVFFEGSPVLEPVLPFQMGFHPQAKRFVDSPYCTRTMLMPIEWLETFNKKAARALGDSHPPTSGYGAFFEQELLSTGGFGQSSFPTMDLRAFFTLWQFYLVPCPKHPKGLFIMAAGYGHSPDVLVHYGENPYGELPFVHFKLLSVPGRALGDCFVPALMPPQRAFNRFNGQIIENANFIANPMLFHPHSIPADLIDNTPGKKIPFRDGMQIPPFYLGAPPLPPFIIDARNTAREYMAEVAAPVGPGADDMAMKATSGIQLSLMEEMRQRKVSTVIRRWEMAWERTWKLYLRNWARFQRVPRAINVPRDEVSYKASVFQSTMRVDQVSVRIVKWSSMPTSRVATFAEWIELLKSGAVDVRADDRMRVNMFEDIGKGHMVRGWSNFNADMEKARRNLHQIRNGLGGLGPEMFDDLDAHLAVYSAWQKSPEFEPWQRGNPEAAQMFWQVVFAFQLLKERTERARLMQAAMLEAGGGSSGFPFSAPEGAPPGSGGVAAAGKSFRPGAPQGGANPEATRGFGSKPNPFAGDGRPPAQAGLID